MPNDVRTCGQECVCYDSQTGQTGNCRLYGAFTNPDQIKPLQRKAYEGDSCRYGLTVGEETPSTSRQFLLVLHQRADPFLVFPNPKVVDFSDIDPAVLAGLEQRARPQLQTWH